MSLSSQETATAIDALVSLLQSLKHVDHQAASKQTVDKLNQLKNGTLVITDEDVATTFEHIKEHLTEEIKVMLNREKDTLVKAMENVLRSVGENETAKIIQAGDQQLAEIKKAGEDIKSKLENRGAAAIQELGQCNSRALCGEIEVIYARTRPTEPNIATRSIEDNGHSAKSGIDTTSDERPPPDNFARDSPLCKIQAWLIEQYWVVCVAPISMLNADRDVPLERIYVPPSIKELKRGQKDWMHRSDPDQTTTVKTAFSSYKDLLFRDGKPVNTIYIQGEPGCGKTTFCTKLALDWCKAHSLKAATVTKIKDSSKGKTHIKFGDLDTLRDYDFLFFVSLGDYSGSKCSVSRMVEEEVRRNELDWDNSVWEHKCIVLTDAADEWYHPQIPFPPPTDSTCKCRKDRTMPLYLQRANITNIITARPWKFTNLHISDTLTRIFDVSGVSHYKTLARNVMSVLAEIDGSSNKEKQDKTSDLWTIVRVNRLDNLIEIPANCVQLVHQFYSGGVVEGSLCAVYSNMLDMHIAKGLKKLQLEEFDDEEKTSEEIPEILQTESNEYLHDNLSLVCSASRLAFKTLTGAKKETSIIFGEKIILEHMTKKELDFLLHTGIITKRKSLALSSSKRIPYMFVHKTFQEFLASLYISMNQKEIDAFLNAIQLAYCDCTSILDIGQLFIFTCGMCPPAAERMSKHIMDVITRDTESKLQNAHSDAFSFKFPNETHILEAQRIVLDGFYEGSVNKHPCLPLALTHVTECFDPDSKANKKALIDMNISQLVSLETMSSDSPVNEKRVNELLIQSRQTLAYLILRTKGKFDLQQHKLKYFECWSEVDITDIDCSSMVVCNLQHVTLLTEDSVLTSMSATGSYIRFLDISGCQSVELLCKTLPKIANLHNFTLSNTNLADTQLHDHLPESIRNVGYDAVMISARSVKLMVEWSTARDVSVKCRLNLCQISYQSADETEIIQWLKQHDDIDCDLLGNIPVVLPTDPHNRTTSICWSKR